MSRAIVKRARKRRMNQRNDGVALILTLLFVVLLTVLVVEFSYEAQVESAYALNSGNEYQARLAARSAIYNGIAILETDRLETELAVADGSTTPSDSRLSAWAQPSTFDPLNDAVMRTTISDEFGKINLNALVYYDGGGEPQLREHIWEALVYFFQQRDDSVNAEALVDSIRDWIDEDEDVDGDGAESEFYQSAETPYPCKNGPMDSIDELLLIKGMTPDLYFGKQNVEPIQLPLSEYLTVHGDWLGRINPNTVHVDYDTGISEVLEAMREGWIANTDVGPLAEDVLVEDILLVVLDVEAGQPFAQVGDLSAYVTPAVQANVVEDTDNRGNNIDPDPNLQQNQQDSALRKMFTVYSHIFRIQGDALLDDIMVRNEAYVFRVPQDDNLYEWPAVQSGQDPSVESVQIPVPEEFYRILEWKVIQ